jgi:hypothetical protein
MPFISECYLFWFLYYSHFTFRVCWNLNVKLCCQNVKSWIVISYKGLRFSQKTMAVLVLESDAACTCLSGHSAVLCLVWCCKARDDRKQVLWRYWLLESCIKQWHDKPRCYSCISKKCGLEEEWSSVIPVSRTLPKCTDVQCGNTRFRNISDQTHWPVSTLA